MEFIHIFLKPDSDTVWLSARLQFVSPGEKKVLELIRVAPVCVGAVGIRAPMTGLNSISYVMS